MGRLRVSLENVKSFTTEHSTIHNQYQLMFELFVWPVSEKIVQNSTRQVKDMTQTNVSANRPDYSAG
jgi:hypothetical protein